MPRWAGTIIDPNSAAGGTTLDLLKVANTKIPIPTQFLPVTDFQVTRGSNNLPRDAENRGLRASAAPIPFQLAPGVTFTANAYPRLVRPIMRNAIGGAIVSSGASPTAVTSTVSPLQLGAGKLPTLVAWLLRDGIDQQQLDRLTGLVVGEFTLNLPIDGEGTIAVTGSALYRQQDAASGYTDPSGAAGNAIPNASYADYVDSFMLMRATAYRGSASTEISALAGVSITYNNGLIDDPKSRFQPNKNIRTVTDAGKRSQVWYPRRHKFSAQNVSGRIDFSDVDVAAEARADLAIAEKLVLEVAAGPLATTPASEEMLRITIYQHVLSGDGADPLQREGDQTSSYDFTGHLDPVVGKDFDATFVGAAALT